MKNETLPPRSKGVWRRNRIYVGLTLVVIISILAALVPRTTLLPTDATVVATPENLLEQACESLAELPNAPNPCEDGNEGVDAVLNPSELLIENLPSVPTVEDPLDEIADSLPSPSTEDGVIQQGVATPSAPVVNVPSPLLTPDTSIVPSATAPSIVALPTVVVPQNEVEIPQVQLPDIDPEQTPEASDLPQLPVPDVPTVEATDDQGDETDQEGDDDEDQQTPVVPPPTEEIETPAPTEEEPTPEPETTSTPVVEITAMPTMAPTEALPPHSVEGVSETVDENGGVVVDPSGIVSIAFEPGAVDDSTVVEIAPVTLNSTFGYPYGYTPVIPPFSITAKDAATGEDITYFEPEYEIIQVDVHETGQSIDYYEVNPLLEIYVTVPQALQGTFNPRQTMMFYLDPGGDWHPMLAPFDSSRNAYRIESDHLTVFSFTNGGNSTAAPTVFIDPDHGGVDPGGQVLFPPAYAEQEKNINLKVSLQLRDLLTTCGVNVIMSRETDTSVSRPQRAAAINWYAPDASVTVAFNITDYSMTTSQFTGSGPQIWRKITDQNTALGDAVLSGITEQTDLPSRGQSNAATWAGVGLYLPMNVDSNIPHVHSESAFMDNYYDRAIIDDHPEWFAQGFYNALANYTGASNCTFIEPSPLRSAYKRVYGIPWWLPQYRNVIGADPVYLPTGNFLYQERDIDVASPGLPVVVERTYNHLDVFTQSSMGARWSSNLDTFLYFNQEDGAIDWKLPDGQVYIFTPTDSGAYEGENGVHEVLYPPGQGGDLGASPSEYVIQRADDTRWFFNTDGKLVRIEDSNGNQQLYRYGANGALAEIEDSVGRIYTITVDGEGRFSAITLPDGGTTQYGYDATGNLISVTDADGRTTSYEYDDQSRITAVIDPNGTTVVRNFYDADGRVDYQIDGNGETTDLQYAPNARITRVIDGAGNVSITEYDEEFRPIRVTDGAGNVTEFVYDEDWNLARVIHPDGGETRREFDEDGNMVAKIDPNGARWEWAFNSRGYAISETDPLGQVTEFKYDDDYNLVEIIAPDGSRVVNEYDQRGLLVEITYPDNTVETMVYDQYGHLDLHTDALQNTTDFDSDILGRVIRTEDALGRVTQYAYNRIGWMTSRVLPDGSIESYQYDGNGNLIQITDALQQVWTYEYTPLNQLAISTNPLGDQVSYEYNGAGDLVSVVDELGRVTQFTYDGAGYPLTTTDALGHVTTYTRDPMGRTASMMDAAGAVTEYEYDLNGQLVSATDALGGVTTWQYDLLGRIVSMTNPRGGTTTYTYDLKTGNLLTVAEALGIDWQFSYDIMGRVMTTIQPDGSQISFERDALGRVIVSRDALARETTYTYNAVGHLIAVTNPLGATIQLEYDLVNNLVKTTSPLGSVETLSYNLRGELTSSTDANGNTTLYERDALGRVTRMTDPLGHVTTYQYDAVSNLIEQTNALGHTWQTQYDLLNRPIRVINPLGLTTTYAWTSTGQLATTTLPNGAQTQYAYDMLQRLLQVTDAEGYVTQYTYDPNSNLTQLTNAEGYITQFEYDLRDRLTKVTDALGRVEGYTYDLMDRVVTVNNARGAQTQYHYDVAGQLRSTVNPLGITRSLDYDAAGNIITSTDGNGHVTRFEYDLENQLLEIIDPIGAVTEFTYDSYGNLLSTRNPIGAITQFEYDALHNVTALTDAEQHRTEFEYDAVQQMVEVRYANGGIARTTFDPLGRISQEIDALGGVTRYEYNLVDDLVAVTNANNHTTTFTYNLRHELTSVTTALGFTDQFVYDGVGNITEITNGRGFTMAYEWDGVGNLVKTVDALGGITAYSYDAVNNRTSVTTPLGHTTNYVYDLADRLLSVALPLGQQTLYTWDNNDNLLTTTDALGAVTSFVYDPRNLLIETTDAEGHTAYYRYDDAERLVEYKDRRGFVTEYGYDRLDQLIAVEDALGNTTTYEFDVMGGLVTITDANNHITIFENDLLGRVIVETNAEGGEWRYVYDGVGNRIARKDANGATTAYRYDEDERLIRIEYPDGTTNTYIWDENSNLVGIFDPNGATITEFDELDRLTRVSTDERDLDATTHYTYDADSHVTSVIYPNGEAVNYAYNENGWLTELVEPSGARTVYTLDDLGRAVHITYPNGTEVLYTYNLIGRPTRIENRQVNSETIATFDYLYDENSNVTLVLETRDGNRGASIAREFRYDPLNQVVYFQEVNGHDQGHNLTTDYSYDPVGNLIRMEASRLRQGEERGPAQVVDLTYNVINCLTQSNDTTYLCDANGNRIRMEGRGNTTDTPGHSQSDQNSNGQQLGNRYVTEYSYDFENRLVKVHHYPLQGNSGAANNLDEPSTEASTIDLGDSDWLGWGYPQTEDDAGIEEYFTSRPELDLNATPNDIPPHWRQGGYWIRWTREITVPVDGLYTFELDYTYGLTLEIDGVQYLYDQPGDNNRRTQTVEVELTAGTHTISLLHGVQRGGNGRLMLNVTGQSLLPDILRGHPGEYRLDYRYDALGRMVGSDSWVWRDNGVGGGVGQTREINPETYGYLHNGWGYDVIVESLQNAETPQPVYLYRDSQHVISHRNLNSGTQSYAYYDHLHHVVALVDGTGETGHGYRYAPYGELDYEYELFKPGNSVLARNADPQPRQDRGPDRSFLGSRYLWGGHLYEPQSELSYYGSRWYNAITSNWMTQDLYRGEMAQPLSLNRYAYVMGNPASDWDLYGFICILVCGGDNGGIKFGLDVGFAGNTVEVSNKGVQTKSHLDVGFAKYRNEDNYSIQNGALKHYGSTSGSINLFGTNYSATNYRENEIGFKDGGFYWDGYNRTQVKKNGEVILDGELDFRVSTNKGVERFRARIATTDLYPPPPREFLKNKLGESFPVEPNTPLSERQQRFNQASQQTDKMRQEVDEFAKDGPLHAAKLALTVGTTVLAIGGTAAICAVTLGFGCVAGGVVLSTVASGINNFGSKALENSWDRETGGFTKSAALTSEQIKEAALQTGTDFVLNVATAGIGAGIASKFSKVGLNSIDDVGVGVVDDLGEAALDQARFAQKTYSYNFSPDGRLAGETIDSVSAKLQMGILDPDNVPVDYIVRDGNTLILNTRSANALMQADVPTSQWTLVNRTGMNEFEERLTQQLTRNNLTSEGTAITTLTVPQGYHKNLGNMFDSIMSAN